MHEPRPRRVLLADDSPVQAGRAANVLDALGIPADVVSSGERVLGALASEAYEVILMDLDMPLMNGLETTRLIRKRRERDPYVIALTADTAEGTRARCLAAGMDDVLHKPLHVGDLVAALERWNLSRVAGARRPSSEEGEEAPSVESTTLEHLRRMIGDDGLSGLIRTFLDESERNVSALSAAEAQGDVEEFIRAAHSLKGTSHLFGLQTLSTLCGELESLSRTDVPLATLASLVAKVDAETARARARLSQHLGGPAPA